MITTPDSIHGLACKPDERHAAGPVHDRLKGGMREGVVE